MPTQTWAPVDGDLSRMKGDLEITIGAVAFDSGSLSLSLLSLFNAGKPVVDGYIEPIVVKIRRGVITYDRFDVRIDKYTLRYTGSIDLKTDRIDLRTEIPLEALALTFKELEGYVDKITVPIVTRGTLDDYKTEIDPDFDLGAAAAEAGFHGVLQNVLGDILGGRNRGGGE